MSRLRPHPLRLAVDPPGCEAGCLFFGISGLKIGVMGCIVNGPGEMADADYGYVGAGPGRVSIYRNKELVIKNIPTAEALPALLDLIRTERGANPAD